MAKIILNVDLQSGSAEQELAKFKKSIQGLGDPKGVKNIDNLRKGYANLINTIQGSEKNYAKGTFSKIAEEAKKYLDEVKKLDPATADYAKQSRHLDDELKRLQADFAETRTGAKNLHGSLKDIVSGFMKFQLAATLVMKPLQLMKNAYDDLNETLVETEKRIVALRRVAGDSANATDLYNLAQKYGQTFDNVADVVENLVKSGYTWEESLKAAEPALLAINVAELDATQATEGLIAVVKQYGMELEDLNYIQGVLNKTADNAAVTTEKLLIALQKTGSTAKNANISFEETVGLITALSEGTAASGQNIGNALRSLIVFTSDSKALDTFAGLSSGMAEIVKNYRAGQASILDIWKGLGGELQGMNSQKGTLEDLFGGAEMTADIEAQLTQITDSFAEIYGTAGNYRQNYFIALLDNIEKVEDATKDLGDATSYSQKENDKYLQTYEAKVNKLNAQWKDLANDEQGFLAFKKGMVDVASDLLTAVDAVGGLEGLLGTTTAILTPFLLKWTITFGASAISAAKAGIVSFFTSMKAGALSANAALGLTGVLLGTVVTLLNGIEAEKVKEMEKISESISKAVEEQDSLSQNVSELEKKYKNYIEQIVELKTVLDSSASTEEEKESAQSELLIIQDKLIESNKNYAESLDLVNGKLEDQVELLDQSKYDQQKQAVIDYYKKNTDAYSKLDAYFTKEYGNINFSEKGSAWEQFSLSELESWLISQGYYPTTTHDGNVIDAALSWFGKKTNSTTLLLNEGATIEDALNTLLELENLAYETGASEYVIGQIREQINKIVNSEEYKNAILLRDGSSSAGNFAQSLSVEQLRAIANGTMSDAEFEKLVNDFFKIEESTGETQDNVNGINKGLSDLNDNTLKETINKLRQARDLTQSTYEYEEKKKAVLEAEQNLLDLQNNRTSYVLNRETGQWEWMVNERDLQKAEEALEQARYEVEKAAYDSIIEELENGNDTSKALLKVVALWAGAYGSGDFSAVEKTITSILRDAGYLSYTPTDWKKPENAILSHEGLLFDTPSSMSHTGLLFGAPSRMPMSSEINRNNTFSDSHNVTYHVNGVPISSGAAETFTVGQLIRELGNYY